MDESRRPKAGDAMHWKARPTEAEAEQIQRWEQLYGKPPYTYVGYHEPLDPSSEAHHPHFEVQTPSRLYPKIPVHYFDEELELEPTQETPAEENEPSEEAPHYDYDPRDLLKP